MIEGKTIIARKVKTKIIGKKEIFKLLFVAEDIKYPLLLIGERGTGKTQLFLDYISSQNITSYFVRQLNYDTRVEDLLGYLSIPALREGKILRINGIQDATHILLDEIDKAPSSVRNLFLSLLRERKIFDGEKMISCDWKLLVGTTNKKIEEFDPEDLPFLDRFLLKAKVERIGVGLVREILYKTEEEFEIDKVEVDVEKHKKALSLLEKALSEIYDLTSDRTIARLPAVLKSFLSIENNDVNTSLLKTIAYTISEEVAFKIIDKIISNPEILKAKELIEQYNNVDEDQKNFVVASMIKFIKEIKMNTSISRETIDEVIRLLKPYISIGEREK